MSKSWADVEDEFPPSPPSKPQPAPPSVPKLAVPPKLAPEASGPPRPVYLKMNRFAEPTAAAAPAPRPNSRGASDRGLWEPASGNGGFPGFEASRGGGGGGIRSAKPKPAQPAATARGKFELQLKNVPSELAPDEVMQAEVRRVFEGLTLSKVKRNAKNQLVFLEVNSKQAMDDALCRLLPEGWELKPVATKDKPKPQAAATAAAPAAAAAAKPAAAAPKPAKKPQPAAKKEEAKKPASNSFGALYDDSDESEEEEA